MSAPGLLRFLLDRLDDEIDEIMMNLPTRPSEEMQALSRPFFDRLLDRNFLHTRAVETKEMVLLVAQTLGEEQDDQLISDSGSLPVTAIGSQLLKMWASRYADHPQYQARWRPAPTPPLRPGRLDP